MKQGSEAVHKIQEYLKTKAYTELEERLCKFAEWAVEYSIFQREYLSFTGNTVTSLTAGVYRNGKLTEMISSSNKMPSPIRIKVVDGEVAFLDNPYEGQPRRVRGKSGLGVTPEYGHQTALKMLKQYKPPSNVPVAMVMCVGTEYASYLETSKGLNVLAQTWIDADPVIINILKQSIA